MTTAEIGLPLSRSYRPSRLRDVASGLLRSRAGTIGLCILMFHVVIALAAPAIIPYDYKEQNSRLIFQPPSVEHPFGTDNLGRDVFSRTLMGGRAALLVTFFAAALSAIWGGLAGMLLGSIGGRADELAMRLVDAFLSLPWLLFLLLMIALVGNSLPILVLTLGFLDGFSVIRIARAATLDVVAKDYVTAARARGERRLSIVRREVLPNVLDVLMVDWAMRWSWQLIGFSSLSFLGFGVTPPTPDWGLMIADNRQVLSIAPWATLFPLLALTTLIIAINLTADALAKALGLDRTQGAPR
jgi:peptide/nickel transport system permease protein